MYVCVRVYVCMHICQIQLKFLYVTYRHVSAHHTHTHIIDIYVTYIHLCVHVSCIKTDICVYMCHIYVYMCHIYVYMCHIYVYMCHIYVYMCHAVCSKTSIFTFFSNAKVCICAPDTCANARLRATLASACVYVCVYVCMQVHYAWGEMRSGFLHYIQLLGVHIYNTHTHTHTQTNPGFSSSYSASKCTYIQYAHTHKTWIFFIIFSV